MKFQGHQRGPLYTFQIESPVQFLTNDLFAIAYKSADVPKDFAYATAEEMARTRFLMGNLCSTYANDAINIISLSFEDNEVCSMRFVYIDMVYVVVFVYTEHDSD
jgi:hypothetical protein